MTELHLPITRHAQASRSFAAHLKRAFAALETQELGEGDIEDIVAISIGFYADGELEQTQFTSTWERDKETQDLRVRRLFELKPMDQILVGGLATASLLAESRSAQFMAADVFKDMDEDAESGDMARLLILRNGFIVMRSDPSPVHSIFFQADGSNGKQLAPEHFHGQIRLVVAPDTSQHDCLSFSRDAAWIIEKMLLDKAPAAWCERLALTRITASIQREHAA